MPMTPRIEDTRQELSCWIVKRLLGYVRGAYGVSMLQRLAVKTGMPLDYLEDEGNWVSFDYYIRLLESLVEETGNRNAPYEAGAYKENPFGFVSVLARHLVSVEHAYRVGVRWSERYGKVADERLLGIGPGRAVIEYRYREGFRQTSWNCDNIRGFLAMVPSAFGLPFATIVHEKCAARGADACVYEITWQRTLRYTKAFAGMFLGFGVSLLVRKLGIIPGEASWLSFALLPVMGFWLGHIYDIRRDMEKTVRQNIEEAEALHASMGKIEQLNAELEQRVKQRTDELNKANAELERILQDLRENQEKRILAERQAAIGVLAAGTAHEMNSPLNAIKLCAQNLAEEIPGGNPLRASVENVERAASRCDRIVRQLLAFSREPHQASNARLEDILAGAVAMFNRENTSNVRVRVFIAPDLPRLSMDRMQIQQAVINLLNNAADAMGGTGDIEVRLDFEPPNVVLSVSDRGPGISEEARRHLFDPFFTTKKNGKGLGLGLSITYQLVTRNNGAIDVRNRQEQGTTFAMRFPVGPENQAGVQP